MRIHALCPILLIIISWLTSTRCSALQYEQSQCFPTTIDMCAISQEVLWSFSLSSFSVRHSAYNCVAYIRLYITKMVHTCRLQNIDISTKPKSTLVAISLSVSVPSCVELICYQLVVLRITLYFGIVVSSKRSTAAQAHACDAITRVRIRDILTIREVRAAVHIIIIIIIIIF